MSCQSVGKDESEVSMGQESPDQIKEENIWGLRDPVLKRLE